MLETAATTPESFIDEARERCVALGLAVAVLVTLTAVKPLGAIPLVGTVAYTVAAALQLYLPMWRADRLKVPLARFGLTLTRWRSDVALALLLCAITFPPYAFLHHWYMTAAHDVVRGIGLKALSDYFPQRVLAPRLPYSFGTWFAAASGVTQLLLTHIMGVALPEETFYRGYLEPRLATLWPAQRRYFGVALGRATLVTAALFALGHFLGEWNPLRLGPFFPALLFSWLRGRSDTIVAAVTYHAACNLFGEMLFALYRGG